MLYTSMYSRASTKLTRTTNFVHSNEAATRSILYTNEYSSDCTYVRVPYSEALPSSKAKSKSENKDTAYIRCHYCCRFHCP